MTYPAQDGFVYFAPPGVTHSFPKSDDMHVMEIKFVAEGEIAEQINKLPLVFNISNMPFALERLSTAVCEVLACDMYFQECSNYAFRLFFISILKTFSKSSCIAGGKGLKIPESVSESNDVMILDLKHYMLDNLAKNITLDELAERVHFNKSYFVRRFKLLLGESPMKYLNNLRIE